MELIQKNLLVSLFIILLVSLLSIFISSDKKTKVLSYFIDPTPTMIPKPTLTPTPTPSPTPTPTPTPIPTPTSTPTPTPVPQPQFSQEEIHALIERFAGQYGVDPNVLRHLAVCESGFRQEAINGLYLGLFQYAKTTWKNIRILMGEDPDPDLRLNAEESVQTAAYSIAVGKKGIWPNCFP